MKIIYDSILCVNKEQFHQIRRKNWGREAGEMKENEIGTDWRGYAVDCREPKIYQKFIRRNLTAEQLRNFINDTIPGYIFEPNVSGSMHPAVAFLDADRNAPLEGLILFVTPHTTKDDMYADLHEHDRFNNPEAFLKRLLDTAIEVAMERLRTIANGKVENVPDEIEFWDVLERVIP
jgi:hypothetical protein